MQFALEALDLTFKGYILSLSAQLWMGLFSFAFAVMLTTISDENQNFEMFGQNQVF